MSASVAFQTPACWLFSPLHCTDGSIHDNFLLCSPVEQHVKLNGPHILPEHCVIEIEDGEVAIFTAPGALARQCIDCTTPNVRATSPDVILLFVGAIAVL